MGTLNLSNKYIVGECMEMCPQAEIILREKERLLHILEITPGNTKHGTPVADKRKCVKSFARSAAGKNMHNPKHLRPPQVLLKTVSYLLEEVILNEKVPWLVAYDFIMDRLRSVRQDMIIQNVSVAESICILQPVVRFYAYASYRLCDQSINNFDPHINQTHLQECLKRLLYLYDECDYLFLNEKSSNNSYCMNKLDEVRPSFEALYLVFNLGNPTALARALNLSKRWRNSDVKLAMKLSLNYFKNNFVKVCNLIKELPVLLQGVAAIHLPELRRRAYKVMSVAYNSNNLTFPLKTLQKIFMYKDLKHVQSDCVYYGLKCNETEVQFLKTNFDCSKNAVQPTRLEFIDEALNNFNLCDLILNGQLTFNFH